MKEKTKEYEYILPGKNNEKHIHKTNLQSMIIIGANGSGKSRLGAWIEKNMANKTHRISAQRALMLGEYITQKSYEQATNLLTYGRDDINNSNTDTIPHDAKWTWKYPNMDYTTALLNDYEDTMAALIALNTRQEARFVENCRQREKNNESHEKVPEMVIDKLKRIWSEIFPHRNINIDDNKITCTLKKGDKNDNYKGSEMSDGERVGLYLIAQCLSLPENKIIIIDEPEIHLHRSIMNRLWSAIEAERKDCFFVYITHDTQFASNHRDSKKIWVKEYDGDKWEYQPIEDNNLPQQLLMDVLGSRKPVLFVEGTSTSYDIKLYSMLYKDFYVVPCGSCDAVIKQTKAMNNHKELHNFQCFGIIDRDTRSEHEIDSFKKDNIFTLNVAEVENLFLTEEILQVVREITQKDEQCIDEVKKYINNRFKEEMEKQIDDFLKSEIKFELSKIDIDFTSEGRECADTKLKEQVNNILKKCFNNDIENKFKKLLENGDYKEILKVFNCKGLSNSIGHYLGLDNKSYKDFIIGQLYTDRAEQIVDALHPYLPEKISINTSI